MVGDARRPLMYKPESIGVSRRVDVLGKDTCLHLREKVQKGFSGGKDFLVVGEMFSTLIWMVALNWNVFQHSTITPY